MGTIIFLHQQLGQHLDKLAWPIIGGDPSKIEAMTAMVKEFEAKIDLISQLIHMRFSNKKSHRDARIRKAMNRLHEQLDNVNGARNDLVHGMWKGWNEHGLGLVRYAPKTSAFSWKIKVYTPAQLEEVGRKMFAIDNDLNKLAALVYRANEEEAAGAFPRPCTKNSG